VRNHQTPQLGNNASVITIYEHITLLNGSQDLFQAPVQRQMYFSRGASIFHEPTTSSHIRLQGITQRETPKMQTSDTDSNIKTAKTKAMIVTNSQMRTIPRNASFHARTVVFF